MNPLPTSQDLLSDLLFCSCSYVACIAKNIEYGPWSDCSISDLEQSNSALDKLLGQLGIYPIWLSSIAYLQKQLRIFFIFLRHVFGCDYICFLLKEAIANVPSCLLSSSAFLSIKLADFYCTWSKSHRLVDISCSHPFCKVFPRKHLTGGDILFIKLEL